MNTLLQEHPALCIFADKYHAVHLGDIPDLDRLAKLLEVYRRFTLVGGYGVNASEDPRLRLMPDGRPETITIVNAGILALDIEGSSTLATLLPKATGENIMEVLSAYLMTHLNDIVRSQEMPWRLRQHRRSFGGDSMHISTETLRAPNGRVLLNQLDIAAIVGAQLTAAAKGVSETMAEEAKLTRSNEPLFRIRTGITQDSLCYGDIFTLDRSLGDTFERCQESIHVKFKALGLPYRHPMSPGGLPAAPANSLSPGMNEASRYQGAAPKGYTNITSLEYLQLFCPALQPLWQQIAEGVEPKNIGKRVDLYGLPEELADYRELYRLCKDFYERNVYH